jgi:hypothetical protein
MKAKLLTAATRLLDGFDVRCWRNRPGCFVLDRWMDVCAFTALLPIEEASQSVALGIAEDVRRFALLLD